MTELPGSPERPRLEQHRRFGYRPQLDGLRAVAIIPVVTFHAWVVPRGGYLGVDIFFVLSGFLITTLLVGEGRASGRISLPHFYLRRVLRLFPALVVAVAVYAIYTSAEIEVAGTSHSGTPLSSALEGSLYGVLYVQNILIAAGTAMPVAIGHLWSLATEEQFYLVWPFVLFLAFRGRLGTRLLSGVLVVVIAALALERIGLIASHASFGRVYFAPDGHFDVILIGCLAGLWYATGSIPRPLARPWFRHASALFGVAAVTAMFVLPYVIGWRVLLDLLPVFAALIALAILVVVTADRTPLALLLSLPPLVFVGKISYALYLWHPIFLFGFGRLPRVVEVGLAFGAAVLSYYVVELPFLRLKRRDRARVDAEAPTRPVAVATS